MSFLGLSIPQWVIWAVAAPFIFGAALLLGAVIGLLSVRLAEHLAVYFMIASPFWGLGYLGLFFYLRGAGGGHSEQ